MPEKTASTEAYWRTYCEASGHHGKDYDVIRFGDSAEMADELLELVLAGTKRATASLVRDFEPAGLPLPKTGDFVMVLDGRDVPACIYQSSDVRIGALSSVDDAFAWDEGEGDRSRTWWLGAHIRYFSRQADAEGFNMHMEIETVFERFRVVWPPEAADNQSSR